MSPEAGIDFGFGIWRTTSGWSIFQPSVQRTGGGASCGLPAGACASAHAERVAIWSGVRDGSFEKRRQQGSAGSLAGSLANSLAASLANQGGMVRFEVTVRIAAANGRTC